MKTIIIYDTVPEDTSVYVVENAPDWVRKCHGVIINLNDYTEEQMDAMDRLLDAIQENPQFYHRSAEEHPERGQWAQHKLQVYGEEDSDGNMPILPIVQLDTNKVEVILCGFIL